LSFFLGGWARQPYRAASEHSSYTIGRIVFYKFFEEEENWILLTKKLGFNGNKKGKDMIPIFLTLFLSCAASKEIPPTNIELPTSGSFCFDGFIKNFLAMSCKEKRTGEGPMESQVFSCQLGKDSTKYFIIIPSNIEDINPAMIICQDRNIIIVEYSETGA
jgi:hypothetical protein